MEILQEKDGVDTELLVYAMTLINKVWRNLMSICEVNMGSCVGLQKSSLS